MANTNTNTKTNVSNVSQTPTRSRAKKDPTPTSTPIPSTSILDIDAENIAPTSSSNIIDAHSQVDTTFSDLDSQQVINLKAALNDARSQIAEFDMLIKDYKKQIESLEKNSETLSTVINQYKLKVQYYEITIRTLSAILAGN